MANTDSMKNTSNTIGPWYIAIYKDGVLIGWWDDDLFRIRTATICLIPTIEELDRKFEHAVMYLHTHYNTATYKPVIHEHHAGVNRKFDTESKQRLNKVVKENWSGRLKIKPGE